MNNTYENVMKILIYTYIYIYALVTGPLLKVSVSSYSKNWNIHYHQGRNWAILRGGGAGIFVIGRIG